MTFWFSTRIASSETFHCKKTVDFVLPLLLRQLWAEGMTIVCKSLIWSFSKTGKLLKYNKKNTIADLHIILPKVHLYTSAIFVLSWWTLTVPLTFFFSLRLFRGDRKIPNARRLTRYVLLPICFLRWRWPGPQYTAWRRVHMATAGTLRRLAEGPLSGQQINNGPLCSIICWAVKVHS